MNPNYRCSYEDGIFTLRFYAPRQLLLHQDYEAMVHNECLAKAHAAGHIPIGPVEIEHIEPEDLGALVEGVPLAVHPVLADAMEVIARVQIGVSL